MIRFFSGLWLLIILAACPTCTKAQESHSLKESGYYMPDGSDYMDSEMYGLALHQFELAPLSDPVIRNLSISSYMIDETRSIDLLLESKSRTADPDRRNDIVLTIADYYFVNNDFGPSRHYYLDVNPLLLDNRQREAVNFRIAYSFLAEKNFKEALEYFEKAKGYEGDYFIDSWYYAGISLYYLEDREKAVSAFEFVQNSKRYRNIIPYYLAQIHFREGRYREAVSYAEAKLKNGHLADETRLFKILGLSYLALENYDKALEYLDAYALKAKKLTENEFYQIAITHYNLGQYDKAAEFFLELSHQATPIGQVANYLLGSIYLSQDKLKDGQAAFKQAFKYDFYPDIKDASQFLYYKLSANLGDERIAMSGLSKLGPEHPHHKEAMTLLGELLVRTEDYITGLGIIEDLEEKTPHMTGIYQGMAFDYGLRLLEEDEINKSIEYLKTAHDTPGDADISERAAFWLGLAYDRADLPADSETYLNKYLDSGHNRYQFRAYYLKAYQAIDERSYDKAARSLENAIASYDPDKEEKQLFDDVVIRLADLELLDNDYNSAIAYYDLAIENKAAASDYILFQKAMIYGVNGQALEKLTNLELLLKTFSQSSYRDDALFQIGESLLALGKNNEAFQVYRSLVNEYGATSEYGPVSYLRQGLISYNQGDIDSALKYYTLAMENTTDAEHKRQAIIAIEEIYIEDKQDPDSFFEFAENKAGFEIEDYRKDSLSYHIAFAQYKEKQYADAIRSFNKYLGEFRDPHFKNEALYYKAESHFLTGSHEDALYTYEQLTRDKSHKFYPEALKKAALIAFNSLKDFEKSRLLFREWIQNDPDVELSVYESALYSAHVTGKNEEILSYSDKITRHDGATDKSKATAHFYKGKVHREVGEMEKAISDFTRVIALSDASQAAEASYAISEIHYNRGDLEKAEAQAFETTRHAANYPFWVAKSLILIGDIYTQRKDYLNASAAYESVIENFFENPEIVKETQTKLKSLEQKIAAASNVAGEEEQSLIQKDSIE